jgi:hypothetical protein
VLVDWLRWCNLHHGKHQRRYIGTSQNWEVLHWYCNPFLKIVLVLAILFTVLLTTLVISRLITMVKMKVAPSVIYAATVVPLFIQMGVGFSHSTWGGFRRPCVQPMNIDRLTILINWRPCLYPLANRHIHCGRISPHDDWQIGYNIDGSHWLYPPHTTPWSIPLNYCTEFSGNAADE